MELERSSDVNRLTVRLIGEVSGENAADIEDALLKEIDSVTDLVFDLGKLEYISSAGLRVMLMLQKMMKSKGSMTVENVNDDVMEIFRVTGFNRLLNIV